VDSTQIRHRDGKEENDRVNVPFELLHHRRLKNKKLATDDIKTDDCREQEQKRTASQSNLGHKLINFLREI
jgi:hypothetical protein